LTRDLYVKGKIRGLVHDWASKVFVLGAVLFLGLGVMDYFVMPRPLFSKFVFLRCGLSVVLALAFIANRFLSRPTWPISYFYGMFFTAIFFSAATVAVMILWLGGDVSYYYAGLNLLIICVLGVVPVAVPFAVLVSVMIYVTYLAPILLLDTITDVRLFVSNNFFLLATVIVALVWRIIGQGNLTKMFGLQYDLDQDRAKLRTYSEALETLVHERTRELHKSEQMLRALFENANDAILIMDGSGAILDANRVACETYGFSRNALVGTNVALLEVDRNRSVFEDRFARILAGESLLFETEHYRRNGSMITVEVSARAVTVDGKVLVQAFHRDITLKKKMQDQLLHSQKMDSIGQLAGGIAHELNNVLVAILGFAEWILLKGSMADDVREKVAVIEKAGRQGSRILSKLLSFARRGSFEALPFDVNSLVKDTLSMIERLMPSQIKVATELREPVPVVAGDVSQIEQVIMNLLINAKDAMPGGGELMVRTTTVDLNSDDLDIGARVVPGEYVVLEVSDTGSGIAEEDLSRIFEPFFTTKAKGKGTGLGLAMVYGIVKEHKGYITAESTVGQGTTFRVYLPTSGKKPARRGTTDVRGSETVLVIDDEEPIRGFIAEVLQDRGFTVLDAATAEEAIRILTGDPDRIDLVITDLSIGSMPGTRVIDAMREVNPGIPVIAMTGFSEFADDIQVERLLLKPFSAPKLLAVVAAVLGRPVQSGN